MDKLINKYHKAKTDVEYKAIVEEIAKKSDALYNAETLKKIFSLIDLTTLNSTDDESRGIKFAQNVNGMKEKFPFMPDVAAICIYPTLVESVRKTLTVKNVQIASVTAGFPSSQTFISIKSAESKMAIEKGADEIDIVISIGKFLSGNYQFVADEISIIKQTIGEKHVKVILETGALNTAENIRLASLLAMEAGADFIKTSTGKMEPAATPEAMYVMCEAIKDFYNNTGKKIGIKPAGGVATPKQSLIYYSIVKEVLGEEWINSHLFRIGASRLANSLIEDILLLETGEKKTVSYF